MTTREAHARRICDVDQYRPHACPRCGCRTLHVHDYSERKALGDPGGMPVSVVRFVCALVACGATWRVLPAFVARYLWYAWRAVEPATGAESPSQRSSPPTPSESTVARWSERLGATARLLVQIFATLASEALTAMIATLADGIDATRRALVVAYAATMKIPNGLRLSALAGHIHRVVPGVRLM